MVSAYALTNDDGAESVLTSSKEQIGRSSSIPRIADLPGSRKNP